MWLVSELEMQKKTLSDFVGRLANFVGSAWTGVRLQRRQTPAPTSDGSSWGEGAATESPPAASTDKSRIKLELGEDQLRVLEGSCGSAQIYNVGQEEYFAYLVAESLSIRRSLQQTCESATQPF